MKNISFNIFDNIFCISNFQVMTDPDVPGPSDPYLREHVHWYIFIHFGLLLHHKTYNQYIFLKLECLS